VAWKGWADFRFWIFDFGLRCSLRRTAAGALVGVQLEGRWFGRDGLNQLVEWEIPVLGFAWWAIYVAAGTANWGLVPARLTGVAISMLRVVQNEAR
jgi:hypothetical protein